MIFPVIMMLKKIKIDSKEHIYVNKKTTHIFSAEIFLDICQKGFYPQNNIFYPRKSLIYILHLMDKVFCSVVIYLNLNGFSEFSHCTRACKEFSISILNQELTSEESICHFIKFLKLKIVKLHATYADCKIFQNHTSMISCIRLVQ